ncbi:MAG: hypothetical protein QOD89_51 [Bradyrhizobium sp.]|jgi:hypothetical protein|nr:hypothetical protein [Bradyrhizobium sp.]
MLKLVTALSAALIIGWALVGSAATASAGYRKAGCCGPLPPSYTYKTKHVHKHVTRHHDVWRTKYFKRIKPIVHVTRIQPVVHIHNVKRVHTRLVGVVHPVHSRVTQYLPARHYVTNSTVYLRPECGCGGY